MYSMRQLVMTLVGNRFINQSLFSPHLFMYDDLMIYRHRKHLVLLDEITINYNHIVNVNLHQGVFFSFFEIVMAGAHEPVTIKGVPKKPARKAKNIMDQKIFQVHNKHLTNKNDMKSASRELDSFEQSLQRLRELHTQGKISEREYNKKRSQLLKKIS